MKPLVVALVAFGLAAGSCGLLQGKEVAEKAAARFHEQLNDGRFGEIYAEASSSFRRATTEAQLTQLLEAVRRKLGSFKAANERGVHVSTSGSGTLVTLTYESEFAEGRATEEFRYSVSGDRAFLVAYNINSPLLIIR